MIAMPAGMRVWLANGHTDMRRYAECPVMRSVRPGASVARTQSAALLRIITILLDAHRIKEDAYAEFNDGPHEPNLVP